MPFSFAICRFDFGLDRRCFVLIKTLQQVSHEKHHAIVFPLPTQLLDMLEGREKINWFKTDDSDGSNVNNIAVQVA